MAVKERIGLLVILLLLLLPGCTSHPWENDETVEFTATVTKMEVRGGFMSGPTYIKVDFDNGDTYNLREDHIGEILIGVKYRLKLYRDYSLWSIVEKEEKNG